MAAITAAGLVAAHPEWAAVNTNQPAVVAHVILVANAKSFELYANDDEDTNRRYLEAGSLLFVHPYGRDMLKLEPGAPDPYRQAANALDVLKGAAYRGPGWTLASGVS